MEARNALRLALKNENPESIYRSYLELVNSRIINDSDISLNQRSFSETLLHNKIVYLASLIDYIAKKNNLEIYFTKEDFIDLFSLLKYDFIPNNRLGSNLDLLFVFFVALCEIDINVLAPEEGETEGLRQRHNFLLKTLDIENVFYYSANSYYYKKLLNGVLSGPFWISSINSFTDWERGKEIALKILNPYKPNISGVYITKKIKVNNSIFSNCFGYYSASLEPIGDFFKLLNFKKGNYALHEGIRSLLTDLDKKIVIGNSFNEISYLFNLIGIEKRIVDFTNYNFEQISSNLPYNLGDNVFIVRERYIHLLLNLIKSSNRVQEINIILEPKSLFFAYNNNLEISIIKKDLYLEKKFSSVVGAIEKPIFVKEEVNYSTLTPLLPILKSNLLGSDNYYDFYNIFAGNLLTNLEKIYENSYAYLKEISLFVINSHLKETKYSINAIGPLLNYLNLIFDTSLKTTDFHFNNNIITKERLLNTVKLKVYIELNNLVITRMDKAVLFDLEYQILRDLDIDRLLYNNLLDRESTILEVYNNISLNYYQEKLTSLFKLRNTSITNAV